MNQVYEFFLCPIHGVLAVANLPLIALPLLSLRNYFISLYLNYRHNRLRKLGVL